MRSQAILGVLLLLVGLVLLYVLRHVFFDLIVLVIGFFGVLLALVMIAVGLALILFTRRIW